MLVITMLVSIATITSIEKDRWRLQHQCEVIIMRITTTTGGQIAAMSRTQMAGTFPGTETGKGTVIRGLSRQITGKITTLVIPEALAAVLLLLLSRLIPPTALSSTTPIETRETHLHLAPSLLGHALHRDFLLLIRWLL